MKFLDKRMPCSVWDRRRFAGLSLVGVLILSTTAMVTAQDSQKTGVRLPITLEADQRTELRARVEGYVDKVQVDIGDRVKKDQVLVSLDAPELEADVRRRQQMVRQSEANARVAAGRVATARAKQRQAESARDEQAALRQLRVSQRDRFAMLVRGGAVQQEKLDEAQYAVTAVEAAVTRIEADVEAARADVEAATNELEFAKSGIEVAKAELAHATAQDQLRNVRAPFDGLVTDRNVDPGQLVSPGNVMGKPLLVIEHVDVLRGVMTVPADEAALIDVGNRVTLIGFPVRGELTSSDGKELKVSRVSQSLDARTRTMRVEIDIQNVFDKARGRYQLLSGQYGSANVHTN
ncbi:MAG: HlyD family efflux transporter periplasmic adaptor subunit [Pirellulaceae bacterium]|nr:HlyD family efflux transporter periplasmic adaptor subunit [Pirellulaceae bacterium]